MQEIIKKIQEAERFLLETEELLYFKEVPKLQTCTLYEFIKKIISDYRVNYQTYTVKRNSLQCGTGRRRSTTDIFLICKYYYPEVTLQEIIEEIHYNYYTDNTIVSNYCGDVCKIVHKSGSTPAYEEPSITECSILKISRKDLKQCFTLEFINKCKAERNKKKLQMELQKKKQTAAIASVKGFKPRVFTRHPSHFPLRTMLPKLTFRSALKLGSTTTLQDTVENGGNVVEINSTEGVKNSSSKRKMKECFNNANIKTAEWFIFNSVKNNFIQKKFEEDVAVSKEQLPFPLIVKSLFGSRGVGNTLIKDLNALNNFLNNRNNLENYIFEKFYTYSREYRLHVTSDGCFYTCRKMLKKNTPEEKRFQRHDDNCVWIVEENPAFDKPKTWDGIVQDCVKALNALGLDMGAFDVKVQSSKNSKQQLREAPEWIIIESCSAPSFGEITLQKYVEQYPIVATRKAQECGIL